MNEHSQHYLNNLQDVIGYQIKADNVTWTFCLKNTFSHDSENHTPCLYKYEFHICDMKDDPLMLHYIRIIC